MYFGFFHEEGWRTYRPKCCEYKNKDEVYSQKTMNNKNHQASSQKFGQLVTKVILQYKKHVLKQSFDS